MASFPKASHRVRRIAYQARLDLALKASGILRSRRTVLPFVFREIAREERATSISDRDGLDTSSFALQTSGGSSATSRSGASGEDNLGGAPGGIKP